MGDAPPITFLFTDMEGSTRLWEARPDAMRATMERHDALLTAGITGHGGRVILERGEGDSFFAVFDTAGDAVAAASWIQQALAAEPWPEDIPVRVRMAIHSGEADAHLRGSDVNRCARLRAIAHGGQVLVSSAAQEGAGPAMPEPISLAELGVYRLRDLTHPERVFQLRHPELPAEFPPLRSMEAFRHNLPVQRTSFIGRQQELEEVKGLLADHHLVTVVGAGGSGKTRLALQLAAELLDEYGDGCWFVDLAPLSDPELVPLAVAQTLGVREEPGRWLATLLAEEVAGKRMLVVLDNCEHVVQAAAEVAEALVGKAPDVRVLATSREVLNLPGELAWRVPSLSVPDVERLPAADDLLSFEAVRLFCERAAAARPGFVLSPGQGPAVAGICSRLDGIPLAIELAAARSRVLAPEEILSRVEDRFRLLVGGSRVLSRHQTLRATVEWSHQLLDDAERILFRRLAPFAGSFGLDAAEAVGAGKPLGREDVLDLLSRLVDKSLVLTEDTGEGAVRYRLLETLRQYASERLEEAAEAEAAHGRHLAHFLDMVETGYRERVENEVGWLERLEKDHDNLRAALAWSHRHQPDEHLRLAGALGWFWQIHGHHSEGRAHLTQALMDEDREPSPFLARALWSAGTLASWQGDAGAAQLIERSRAVSQALGDRPAVAECLDSLGWTAFIKNDPETALGHFREELQIRLELGNPKLVELAKVGVCQVLVAMEDVDQAAPLAREIIAAAKASRDDRNVHYGYHFAADCALIRGDGTAGEELYGESLRAALAYGDEAETIWEVEGVAMSAGYRGDARRSLRLGGAVESRKEELGLDISVHFWEKLQARSYGAARETLGPAESARVWAEGRSMGWEAAVTEALGVEASG